ncbi:hypothetical protein IGI37_002110 [Enterococcus sp. AZ194]|uniref:DNA-binding protein n=1 Tax=Enterococcus sp. AZ194 TaxID=2774629 RepID=UPI003F26263A
MSEVITREQLDIALINYIPKRYINQSEAVKYTGTSHNTIKKWVKMGLKQIIFDEDSRPKYDVKDLDKWMNEHKV